MIIHPRIAACVTEIGTDASHLRGRRENIVAESQVKLSFGSVGFDDSIVSVVTAVNDLASIGLLIDKEHETVIA